jgi:hypothetical protein
VAEKAAGAQPVSAGVETETRLGVPQVRSLEISPLDMQV